MLRRRKNTGHWRRRRWAVLSCRPLITAAANRDRLATYWYTVCEVCFCTKTATCPSCKVTDPYH